jgi:hypothetical protein
VTLITEGAALIVGAVILASVAKTAALLITGAVAVVCLIALIKAMG